MRVNFEKFCALLEPKDTRYWLENLNINVIEGFLRWYLETYDPERQSGFLIRVRYWRIYYCEEMQREFPYHLKKDMKSLVCQQLTEEYGLIKTSKFQPSVNVDDLLYLVHHLMAISEEHFPTPRQRQQHNTLRKMMTSTSARPGTLLESSGYFKSNDALRWGDIEIFMVKVPDCPSCKVLLIRSKHRLKKGKRNKGSAALTYAQAAEDEKRVCRSAGLKDLGSLYKYRKGAAARLDSNTTEHKRNHIMGQTRGDVFRFYVNQIVNVYTQSIFLETPSRNALLKLSSNSGLTRDPSAPQHLNGEQKNSIRKNPELLELEHQRDILRKDIIAKYGKIGLSRGTPEHTEYDIIMREVRAKRKQLEKVTLDQAYEDFFNNIGNQIIKANFQGNPLCFTPQTSTVLPERKELADLERREHSLR